jgi:hypothetical protein
LNIVKNVISYLVLQFSISPMSAFFSFKNKIVYGGFNTMYM